MLIHLSYSGHDPDEFREVSQEDYDKLVALEFGGKKYLYDTEEGRAFLKEILENRPKVEMPSFIAYI